MSTYRINSTNPKGDDTLMQIVWVELIGRIVKAAAASEPQAVAALNTEGTQIT